MLQDVLVVLGISLLLIGFYGLMKLNYSTNYYSVSDAEKEIRMNRYGYIFFRYFPPLVACSYIFLLFAPAGKQVFLYQYICLLPHIIFRDGKALKEELNGRRYGSALFRVISLLPLLLLPLLFLFAREMFSYPFSYSLLPDSVSMIANIWSAAIISACVGLFLLLTRKNYNTREVLIRKSIKDIGKNTLLTAQRFSQAQNADVLLVWTVMVYENIQRPKWVRKFEALLSKMGLRVTTGIMQNIDSASADDTESIKMAIEFFKGSNAFRIGSDYSEDRENTRKSLVSKYGGSSLYYDDIQSYAYDVATFTKEELGLDSGAYLAVDPEFQQANLTMLSYNQTAKLYAAYASHRAERKDLLDSLHGLSLKKAPLLIEFGCGTGKDIKDILKTLPSMEYCGVDYSERMLGQARMKYPSLQFKLGDVLAWQSEKRADVLVCMDVTHHIPRYSIALLLNNILSNLETNGRVLISFILAEYTHAELKHAEFGERLFVYWSQGDIESYIKQYFTITTSTRYEDGFSHILYTLQPLKSLQINKG